MHGIDVTLLMIRLIVGLTMVAHGWNHALRGGKIAGTARWFESLGLRPGRVHAWMSAVTETGCGLALAAGFLTPLAAGGLLGTMLVAGVIEHRTHGFFIFRNGYEYVLMIAVILSALAISGGGTAALDHAIGFGLSPVTGLAACVGIGAGGAGVLLGACWRPASQPPPSAGRGSAASLPARQEKHSVDITVGQRLRSPVCETEIIVVRAPDVPVELSCCGYPMTSKPGRTGGPPAASRGSTLLGKRYEDEQTGLEVLCTKPGPGALAADGRRLTIKAAKALPASD
jgi:putative oxidoreductase